jgi:hypothetical protein
MDSFAIQPNYQYPCLPAVIQTDWLAIVSHLGSAIPIVYRKLRSAKVSLIRSFLQVSCSLFLLFSGLQCEWSLSQLLKCVGVFSDSISWNAGRADWPREITEYDSWTLLESKYLSLLVWWPRRRPVISHGNSGCCDQALGDLSATEPPARDQWFPHSTVPLLSWFAPICPYMRLNILLNSKQVEILQSFCDRTVLSVHEIETDLLTSGPESGFR